MIMSFDQLEIECNANKINGYTVSNVKTPNTIPIAGLNGPESGTLENMLDESYFNISSTDLKNFLATLSGYADYNIKYDDTNKTFVACQPDVISLTTNGYATLQTAGSTRTVIQWGYSASGTSEQSYSVTFPTSFSATPYVILCSFYWGDPWHTSSGIEAQVLTNAITASGFTWYRQSIDITPSIGGIYWLAIGPI